MLDRTIAYGIDFLFPAGDAAIGASLRDHGEFSKVELDFLLDMAGPAGEFLDVGANIGSIALPFAQARPGWGVTAVEASRMLSGLLSANALNNRLLNVMVVNAAAGDQRTIVEYPAVTLRNTGNFGSLGFGAVQGITEAIGMLRLDDIARPNTSLIKIDVEGFEPQVLKGAARLLAACSAVWVVEATPTHPEASAQTIRAFQSAGYQTFWFFVPFATPTSVKSKPATAAIGDANIVALPPGAPNSWGLTPVGDPTEGRPNGPLAYPYMARYGY
jgi:FkbM family methyltransferase